jgi:hypothetical protein
MKDIPIISISNGGNESFIRDGITLRDYFAAKAMQAFMQNFKNDNDISRYAYALSDAMMKAREI